MALPGLVWLRDRLNTGDAVSGGYQARVGHPMTAGPGCFMSLVFVLAWLIALIPLTLWSIPGWLRSRGRD
ncbi:MAG: hypothetical protein AB7N24_15990 [Dehalococcoidia bacterium]